MASQSAQPDIIDLTSEPEVEVIELDSDGEVVGDADDLAAGGSQPNGTRKKRKKRKKKPSGPVATTQDEEVGPSRAGSPAALDPGVDLPLDQGGRGTEKKSLADRLTEPDQDGIREAGRRREKRERERRRDQDRGGERERDRDRDGYGERDRGEGSRRERERERERRRSRSPRRDRERERDAERTRRRSRSRDRERERDRRKRDKTPDAPLFFEDVKPVEVFKPLENVPGPSNHHVGPSSAMHSEKQAVTDLLLPPHVSITEASEDADTRPLDVPTPEGSDDEEDYIDYLDYGDDRRVRILFPTHLAISCSS